MRRLMGGYPVALRDTRDYYNSDIRYIVIVTLIVVLLTLMLLLRAVVAPLYLVRIRGDLVLRGAGHRCAVLPVRTRPAVALDGAATGLRGAGRRRCRLQPAVRVEIARQAPHGTRYGIIRTLSSTGGVITAAGVIFAASMWGLLFSSIGTVVQGGFVIGAGILLDTFLVRTVTVPAMATLQSVRRTGGRHG